jgi:hypothetical protein
VIVISGALVLVALVLLIIGVVGPELSFVYASIAVSLVSLGFLVVGILQRRGETIPVGEVAPAPAATVEQPADSVTAVIPSQSLGTSRKVSDEPPVAASVADEPAAGTVLVVEGRPRYHVGGCRYLSGKATQEVDVLDAREEGFSPCGVCKPDDALAAQAPAPAEPVVEEQGEEPVVEEDVPGVEVPAPARRTATRAVTKAPAKQAAAKKAPAQAAEVPVKAAARKAPAAVKAPSKAATAAAATAAAAAAPAAAKRPGSVVVIPERGKFHKAECRFVRGVDGTEVLTKSAASRQGYAACGVCKP